MNNSTNVRLVPVATLECLVARVCAARATLDIIHNNVLEYPLADALYGLVIMLSGIEESLDSLNCDSRKETRT